MASLYGDFFEEDEPAEWIHAAFDAGTKALTRSQHHDRAIARQALLDAADDLQKLLDTAELHSPFGPGWVIGVKQQCQNDVDWLRNRADSL